MAKQQQLSPRKYIQTRARKLPIYKCLVNANWRESDLASVTVMRRHVNGNVTAASFLVDLLCLGVKDTHFWFNVDENEITGRLPEGMMIEIDYNLAHNIVWAGHDFAADFGIEPVADFELTRMILEEDNDDIPLIEVHTGDAQGRPRLVASFPGQYSKELGMLRRSLGDGGFTYSGNTGTAPIIGPAEEPELRIAGFGPELISIQEAEMIATEDLLDDELVKSRKITDQMTLGVERYLRAIVNVKEEYFMDLDRYGMLDEDWDLVVGGLTLMPGSNAEKIRPQQTDTEDGEWILELTADDAVGDALLTNARAVIAKYQEQPLVLMDIADFMLPTGRLPGLPELVEILRGLSKDYLLARILIARIAAEHPENYAQDALPEAFSKRLPELYPGFDAFDAEEFYQYFLLQLQLSLEQGDVQAAIRAYKGLSDIGEWSYSLMGLQARIGGMLEQEFSRLVDENGNPR